MNNFCNLKNFLLLSTVGSVMLNESSSQLHAANPKDFKKIYDATMQLLYKISYRVVNDEEAAEDLVHDSLIKMNEKELVFPSLDDAKYWLIRVVKNASLNYAKRKTRERKAYEKVLYEQKSEIEELTPEQMQVLGSQKYIMWLDNPKNKIINDKNRKGNLTKPSEKREKAFKKLQKE